MTDSRILSIGQLCRSPFNVRINQIDINEVEAIERTILEREERGERGLIHALVVHPMKGSKNKFGVHAGGRRYMALKRLIERGDLPTDYAIPVDYTDLGEAELLEESMIENLIRRSLHPYEEAAAVKRISDRGVAPADIAKHLGQSLRWVQQNLRLGNLAPAIFKAFAESKVSLDHAKAFGATEDQQLQIAAWDAYTHLPEWEKTVAVIHRLLKIGDAEDQKLLRFVGEENFRAAGGVFELDLFAGAAEHRGHVVQRGLLRELVEKKLEAERAILRRRTGRDDLRFAHEYPQARHGGVDRDLEFTPVVEELAQADFDIAEYHANELVEIRFQLRQEARNAELLALRDEHVAAIARIEEGRAIALPEGDIYASLVIEASGELEVRWWWASHAAKRAAETPVPERLVSAGQIGEPAPTTIALAVDAGKGSVNQQQADHAAKGEHGFTADGVQIVRAVRREMLRAALVGEYGCGIGHDYLIWSLLRRELSTRDHRPIGARGLARADDAPPFASIDAVNRALKETPAHSAWVAQLDQLRAHASVAHTDEVEAFAAFRDETAEWKELAAAAVAAIALTKTANLDGYRLKIHDHLMWEMGLDDDEALRDLWEPTEGFIALLPRAKRQELADPHLDEATRRKLPDLKATETIAPVTRALKRVCWVHPALQFQTQTTPIAVEEREAAE